MMKSAEQLTSVATPRWHSVPPIATSQLDADHLRRYRHPQEWRALLRIVGIIVVVELILFLVGPADREEVHDAMKWVPRGVLGIILPLIRPGGVAHPILAGLLSIFLIQLYTQWIKRAELLRDGVEVTPESFPSLYATFNDLRARFSMPRTRLFILKSASRSFSLGFREPFYVVLPVGWISLLDEEEMKFILAHELGHIKLLHTHLAPFLGGGHVEGKGIAGWIDKIRSSLLASYQRAQVLSCDRIGLVATGSVRPAFSAIVKTSLGAPSGSSFSPEVLAHQAAESDQGSMRLAAKLEEIGNGSPPLFLRLNELVTWAGLPPATEKPDETA